MTGIKQQSLISKPAWDDRVLANAIFLPTVFLMLQTLLYAVFGVKSTIHYGILGLSACAMVLAVPVWFRRGIVKAIVPYLLAGTVYALQYIIFRENRPYLTKYLFDLLCMVFPAYICVVYTKRWDAVLKAAEKAGIAIVAFGILYSAVTVLGLSRGKAENYSMSFSNYQLLPAMIYLYKFFVERKAKPLIVSLLAIGMAAALGSRGALAAWGVFLLIGIYLSKIKTVYKVMWTIAVVCGVALFSPIMSAISLVLKSAGINSRTVTMLANGSFFTHTSGRDKLYKVCFEEIAAHPILGGGIGSDIRLINGYPHNLFIELLLHHGVFIGGAASIALIVLMWRTYKKSGNRLLWFMFFCFGFVIQMVSGSYLSTTNFWIFVGCCVNLALNGAFLKKEPTMP